MSQTDCLDDLTDDPIMLNAAMERLDELRNRLDVTERALDISADLARKYELALLEAMKQELPSDVWAMFNEVLTP